MKFGEKSLRVLAPDFWADDDNLFYRSVLLGYGVGDPLDKVEPDVVQFVKEHCSSAFRLRALSIAAYESYSTLFNLDYYVSIGTCTHAALAAGVSAMDAFGCVLWGLLFDDAPKRIPSLRSLRDKLKKEGHSFEPAVSELFDSEWCQQLFDARNRMVHRGFWPEVTKTKEFEMKQDLHVFDFDFAKPSEPTTFELDMRTIMVGLLRDFEKWELDFAEKLSTHACYKATVDGPINVLSRIPSGGSSSGTILSDNYLSSVSMNKNPTPEYQEYWIRNHQKTSTPEDGSSETP